ncbi:MAG: hypothetical protein AAF790_06875 [Planctomycetota bacterium]
MDYANHGFSIDDLGAAAEEQLAAYEHAARRRKKDYSRGRANLAQRRRARRPSNPDCGIGARRLKRVSW